MIRKDLLLDKHKLWSNLAVEHRIWVRGKTVVRGSWLVARKSLPAYSNWLWSNLAGGLPTRKPLRSLDGAIYYESKASRAVHFWFITATVHPHRLYAIP